jgi:hypothetical protein
VSYFIFFSVKKENKLVKNKRHPIHISEYDVKPFLGKRQWAQTFSYLRH